MLSYLGPAHTAHLDTPAVGEDHTGQWDPVIVVVDMAGKAAELHVPEAGTHDISTGEGSLPGSDRYCGLAPILIGNPVVGLPDCCFLHGSSSLPSALVVLCGYTM